MFSSGDVDLMDPPQPMHMLPVPAHHYDESTHCCTVVRDNVHPAELLHKHDKERRLSTPADPTIVDDLREQVASALLGAFDLDLLVGIVEITSGLERRRS